jgi:HlyD family secretion protein
MRKVLIVSTLVAAALVGWLYWRQHQPAPFVVSGFVEADEIRVGSRVGGRVAEVLVQEGQQVRQGEPLFRIDPFDLNEQLAQAQAQLAGDRADLDRLKAGFRKEEVEEARAKRDQAAAALDKAVAGPRPPEIDIARERLKSAQASLELARSEFERISRLREQNQAATSEYDRAVREHKAAQADVAAAQQEVSLLVEGTRKEDVAHARAALAEADAALKLAESGYRPEDIAHAQAQVAGAEAQVAAIQTRISELTVKAPTRCVVEAIDLRPGDLVAANAPAVSLLDTARLWVRSYVPEARLGEVRLGESVPVRVDSFPNQRFSGRITYIAQQAEFTPRNIQTPEERSKQVFRVKVTMDGPGKERLRVGMVADVLFSEAKEK